jgi:secreted PhoX family phosphatase
VRLAAWVLLVGCAKSPEPGAASGPSAPAPVRRHLDFSPLSAPSTSEEKAALRVAATYAVGGEARPLRLQTLFHSGDRFGDWKYGDLVDVNGAPLLDADGQRVHCADSDATGLLPVEGQWFLVQHLECMPGGMALTRLKLDSEGTFTAVDARWLNGAAVGGWINPCAGQITPWSTHLGSEEFEPNARVVRDANVPAALDPYGWRSMAGYLKVDPERVDPYAYGWTPEVTIVDASGQHRVVKHKAPGRFSHEIARVLPDGRTVYLSDDNGSGGGFFKFVADKSGDLSAGRLWASRWTAVDGSEAEFQISWIDLGHATNAMVDKALAAGVVRFEDLFDAVDVVDGACSAGFSSVVTANGRECLRLKPGQELLASRLETRRYAALRGATTELEKGEGIAYDPVSGVVYLATSTAISTMLPGELGGGDHMRLARNPCGLVWALEQIGEGMRARVVVAGKPDAERCSWDSISNPDNLSFVPESGTLLIAEDTKRRSNTALWAFDVTSGTLNRVLTAPWGGEVTGIQWFANVEGKGYLTVVIQHPFGEGAAPAGFVPPPGSDRAVTALLGPFDGLR